MFKVKSRFIGLLLIVAIGISLTIESANRTAFIADIALCFLAGGALIIATGAWKKPLVSDSLCICFSMTVIIVLSTFNTRPLLPVLMLFVVIPASSRMPRLGRMVVDAASIVISAGIYALAISKHTVDPVIPLCIAPALIAVIAFTESALKEKQSAEETKKLLDELIKAQKQIADSEAEACGRVARKEIRKTIGGMLVDASVQLEASMGFWLGNPTKAERLVNKSKETINAALVELRRDNQESQSVTTQETIRIVLAHTDHDIGESLAYALSLDSDIVIEGLCDTRQSLMDTYRQGNVDLALVDENLPPNGGLEAIKDLVAVSPEAKCLLLSTFPDTEIKRAAEAAGAIGVSDRSAYRTNVIEEIRRAVRGDIAVTMDVPEESRIARDSGIASMKPDFSAREIQILELIAKGFSNKEIADRLFLAEGTVKNRVSDILQKIGARDRTNAALKARNLGLV